MISHDWLVWQVVDSAFPTGGFAHSWGLESAWQHGEVPDADALLAFARAAMLQAVRGTIPLMNAAYESPDRHTELDALCEAFLTNPVANRASRIQGRALASTAARIWPDTALPSLETGIRQRCGHFAPVAGVVFNALDLPLTTAHEIVLYSTARAVLSAAVRVGLVGSYEAQRLQHRCAADARLLDIPASSDLDALAQAAPLVDLFQARHDHLYSRLFQS